MTLGEEGLEPVAESAPEFSIVIPTFDRPDLLAETVRSVQAQTIEDWECIVVDDCGTLPVGPFDDPRVRVVRREVNGGAAASVNTGVHHAAGRFLTMLADDDLWTPDRLELAREGLARAPLATCAARYLDEPEGPVGSGPEGDVSDTILDANPPTMGVVAIERHCWVDVREDYRTMEDVEWWLRVAQTCEVAWVPKVGYLVRRHDGIRHRSGELQRLHDNRRFMDEFAVWLGAHPRAKAYRLRRLASYAWLCGERREALGALVRSLLLHPAPGTARQLLRTAFRSPGRGPT